MEQEAEILARALGRPRADRAPLTAALWSIGGLRGLADAGAASLAPALDPRALRRLDAILELQRRLLSRRDAPSAIERPEDLVAFLGPARRASPVECFWVVGLDSRGRPRSFEQVAQGTVSGCLVHPREVYAAAVRGRAVSIVVAHNHPSGDPQPSDEDWALTARLEEAGRVLGIPLLDHVVVTSDGFFALGDGERAHRTTRSHLPQRQGVVTDSKGAAGAQRPDAPGFVRPRGLRG